MALASLSEGGRVLEMSRGIFQMGMHMRETIPELDPRITPFAKLRIRRKNAGGMCLFVTTMGFY